MSETLIPTGEFILVKQYEEGMTPGGLYIPDTAEKNKYVKRGIIIAVSDGCRCGAIEPEVDLLYAEQGSVDVVVDGERLKLVREGATFGVIVKTE